MSTLPPDPFANDPSQDPSRIDAEFSRMMEGLNLEAPEFTDSISDEGSEDTSPLAVIVTPVASAKALAGVLRLDAERTGGVDSLPEGLLVLACDSGALVTVSAQQDAAHSLAQRISQALKKIGVMLFVRADDALTATRYRAGERGDDVSPALVLGGLDSLVEELVLGGLDDENREAGIDPRSVSRTKAMSWVALGGRGA